MDTYLIRFPQVIVEFIIQKKASVFGIITRVVSFTTTKII